MVTDQPERLHIARMLVAKEYVRLSSRELSLAEVYAELCDDEYHRDGCCRVLLAMRPDQQSRVDTAVGSLRLVLGNSPGTPALRPLKMMALVTPPGGWEMFTFDGFRADLALALSAAMAETLFCGVTVHISVSNPEPSKQWARSWLSVNRWLRGFRFRCVWVGWRCG